MGSRITERNIKFSSLLYDIPQDVSANLEAAGINMDVWVYLPSTATHSLIMAVHPHTFISSQSSTGKKLNISCFDHPALNTGIAVFL
jgi:hypothetical protein